MSRTSFQPHSAGLDALARSAQMGQITATAAGVGLRYAEALARRYSRTGQHAGSYRVREETVPAGRLNRPRRGAILENTAPHGATVEAGSRSQGRTGRRIMNEAIPIIEAMGG